MGSRRAGADLHHAVYALQAFRAGAKGYVTKSSAPDLLVSAVRDVASGRPAICPDIAEALAIGRVRSEQPALPQLSPREFEVLRMLLNARSGDEIAASLNVSRKTVANYHYAIKSKLGAATDIELIHYGLRHGLISPISPP